MEQVDHTTDRKVIFGQAILWAHTHLNIRIVLRIKFGLTSYEDLPTHLSCITMYVCEKKCITGLTFMYNYTQNSMH